MLLTVIDYYSLYMGESSSISINKYLSANNGPGTILGAAKINSEWEKHIKIISFIKLTV